MSRDLWKIVEEKGRTRSSKTKRIKYEYYDHRTKLPWYNYRDDKLVGDCKVCVKEEEEDAHLVHTYGPVDEKGRRQGLWTVLLYNGDLYETQEYVDNVENGWYELYWRMNQSDSSPGPCKPRLYVRVKKDNNKKNPFGDDFFVGVGITYDRNGERSGSRQAMENGCFWG